jgi:hypothetical protein
MIHAKLLFPRVEITVEAESLKELMREAARAGEVFGIAKCGNCRSEFIRLEHRTPKGFEYFCWRCEDCGARLDFGQLKDGSGFFRKSDKGWYVWGDREPEPADYSDVPPPSDEEIPF